ncbi:unnamed protein product [Triticum turgidum subsp. durum]|uniref:Uncharacterized protein n=1 Tax=Triticum turgidum subsp. durum TaxID=4567 RepID=A0A9R1NUD2_TRITD|nr:unnamed protein product [Triticum turgidum subsp. durum]
MHMQDMFKKERSKCRDYRTRNGHNPTYNQHSRREDWYEDAETFYANQRTNFRSRPREAMQYSMSHHYSVLGLNRSRPEPFSDAEIKAHGTPRQVMSWKEMWLRRYPHPLHTRTLGYAVSNVRSCHMSFQNRVTSPAPTDTPVRMSEDKVCRKG